MNDFSNYNLKAGTAGGALLVLLVNIQSADIIKTGILSMTGALVSFIVSLVLKKLVKWHRRSPRH